MRKTLLRVLIVFGALILAVFVCELAVRVIDPHGVSDSFNNESYRVDLLEVVGEPRLYRHLADREVKMRGFSIHTDSRGARGVERKTPKPDDTKRMLFLGDSVTFGWGVSDDETFVALIEPWLTENDENTWETVNLGHMGYDTTQELGAFDEAGLLYEPDVVVVVFVDNDVVPMAHVLSQQQQDPLTDPNISEEAKDVFRTLNRLNRLRPYLPYISAFGAYHYVNQHPAGQTGSTQHAQELGIDVEEGWRLCQVGLAALRDRCSARGARFCVLDYYSHEMLEEYCRVENIPYGSISFTEEETLTGVRNSDSDAHANQNGHRILTEHMQREFARMQIP